MMDMGSMPTPPSIPASLSDEPEPEVITRFHPPGAGRETNSGISNCGALEYSGKDMSNSRSAFAGHDSQTETESLSTKEMAAEGESMVSDIKVKLQGLWLGLLKPEATEDPLSSFDFGKILALIEFDAKGISGRGFVECMREHVNSGFSCQLTQEQFIAVKELLKTAITCANARNDMATIRCALEVSAQIYCKDKNNVSDYVQRHLCSLPIWEELRFWEGYFDYLMEHFSSKSVNYAMLVSTPLIMMATHMAGLGLADTDAWSLIKTIAGKNNIGCKHMIKLRGVVSQIQQICVGHWGIYSVKPQSMSSHGLSSSHPQDAANETEQPAEASIVGRSWVQIMFSRNTSLRANSFGHVRNWTADSGNLDASKNGKREISAAAQKKMQTSFRTLGSHTGTVTALHCITTREVWDLVGDCEDAGFFISGSTDCTIRIWDPSLRGSELRATLKGHTRTIRAISSDRRRLVSGSDAGTMLVWDKQTTQVSEELKGHEGQVSYVRTLHGERILTASHDGTIKMWDMRIDTSVATVGRFPSAVLCVEYDDRTGILAAGARDSVANIWDIRAGRRMHKLVGHTSWVRSIRMSGDVVITGSDDWTARLWSVSQGTCDALLACHGGPILCVEHSIPDKRIITGSTDGLLQFWEIDEGGIKCTENFTLHTASILSINAEETWLGVAAADNSMSFFHRPEERLGSISGAYAKIAGWKLYRTSQINVAMLKSAASDLERKRICGGGRDGLLRLWDATVDT